MKLINRFLKLLNITYVIRTQKDLTSNMLSLGVRCKKMIIFGYQTKSEKILFETEYQ